MDYPVFGYFAVVCIVAGILFGMAPALQAARADVNGSLKAGSKSAGGVRTGYFPGALVVLQFALAVVLLSGAGLMMRSFLAAQNEFAGIQGERILHARVGLPESRYPAFLTSPFSLALIRKSEGVAKLLKNAKIDFCFFLILARRGFPQGCPYSDFRLEVVKDLGSGLISNARQDGLA